MERTAEMPQLQSLYSKTIRSLSPDAQSREIGEHTCCSGLKNVVEKVETNTAMLKTMLLHSAWRQTPSCKGVNTQEE